MTSTYPTSTDEFIYPDAGSDNALIADLRRLATTASINAAGVPSRRRC